jgi:hypothetical protein
MLDVQVLSSAHIEISSDAAAQYESLLLMEKSPLAGTLYSFRFSFELFCVLLLQRLDDSERLIVNLWNRGYGLWRPRTTVAIATPRGDWLPIPSPMPHSGGDEWLPVASWSHGTKDIHVGPFSF